MDLTDRKTIFDLQSIIERCFEEAKKMNYIQTINQLVPLDDKDSEEGTPKRQMDVITNHFDLAKHISLTIIGELYELEIIRRIAPILMENRALTTDFLAFGEAFQLFYDKEIQEKQLRSLRIHPEG